MLGSSTDGLAVTDAVEAARRARARARRRRSGAGGRDRARGRPLRLAEGLGPDRGRAHALAARLRGLAPGRDVEADGAWPPARGDADLVLNATPVRDELLLDLDGVRQVVDMAYRPDGGETALIAAAREHGCERVVDGLDVLVGQGAASFERWTGSTAPKEVMDAAVRSLSP